MAAKYPANRGSVIGDCLKVGGIIGTAALAIGATEKGRDAYRSAFDAFFGKPNREITLMFKEHSVKKGDTVEGLLKKAISEYNSRTGKGANINIRDLYARTENLNEDHYDEPGKLDRLDIGEEIQIPEIVGE